MAEKEIGYEDLHEFLKGLKITNGRRPTNISGVKTGEYTQPDLIQDAYFLEGGTKLSFTKKGALSITGGAKNALSSKAKLDEFIEKTEMSEEEKDMYTYLSEQLGNYIERLNARSQRRRGNDEEQRDEDEEQRGGGEEEHDEEETHDEEEHDEEETHDEEEHDEETHDEEEHDEERKPKNNEEGLRIMDLSEVNGLADVKKQIEAYEAESKGIRKTEELAQAARDVAYHQRRIEAYQSELDNLDTRYMDHVEENRTKGTIKELIKEEQEALAKAQKAEEDLQKSVTDDSVKKAEGALRDKKSAFYTQAQMKFENEIRKIKHQMEGILISLNEFQYEYKEGTRIPTNGEVVGDYNKQYHELQDRLADLEAAKALCAEQKALVQAEYDKAVEKINEIISRKDNVQPTTESREEESHEEESHDEEEHADEEETRDEEEHADEEETHDEEEHADEEETRDEEEQGDEEQEYEEDEIPVDFDFDEDERRLPVLDGKAIYSSLNFFDRYLLKKEAYILENARQLGPNKEPNIFQKLRLMFPSRKYRLKAENGIKLGRIDVEDVIGYDPNEDLDVAQDAEFEPEHQSDFERNIRVEGLTPRPRVKSKTDNSQELGQEIDEEEEVK